MRKPSLRQIEAFKAFVETGSVSKAADALFVSQPAASKLLNQLELDVGMALIDRSSGRPVPTDRGMRLYEEIDRILSGVDQIGQAIAAIRAEDRSRITIGVMPGFPAKLLANMSRQVRKVRPDISLSFLVRSSEFISHGLLSRKMDIGLTAREVDHARIRTRLLRDDALQVVMQPSHPLAEQARTSITDLAAHPLILFTPGSATRRLTDAAFRVADIEPMVMFEATTAPNCLALVSEGLGCCIASPLFTRDHGEGLITRPLDPEMRLKVFLARPDNVRDEKGVTLVLDVLEQINSIELGV
jgi:DNA-binding transcriptional LysR family regulator